MSNWYENKYKDKVGYIEGWKPSNKDSIPTWSIIELFGRIPVHPDEFDKIDPRLKWFGKCVEGYNFCTSCATVTPEDLSSHHESCCNYVSPEDVQHEIDYNKSLYGTQEERESSLIAEINSGKLTISVGLDVLAHAITHNQEWDDNISIEDNLMFAKELLVEVLNDSTQEPLLYQMLDKAAQRVVESGGLSLKYGDEL